MTQLARTASVALLLCLASSLAAPCLAQEAHPDWAPWTRNSTQPPPVVESVALPPTAAQPGDGPTETICRAAIAWFGEALSHVDELTPAAEAAADGIIAGGKIYAAGSPGFVQELYGRAGGFGFLVAWRGERLRPEDVLLIGHLTPREETERMIDLPTLACGGGWNMRGTVIYISSSNYPVVARTVPLIVKQKWGGRLHIIDTRAPLGGSWSDVSLDQMSAAAMAHALSGEIFAAASRKGKTLATLGSDVEPAGPRWDKSVEGMNVNPKFTIPPIPAGQVAKDYLMTCRNQVAQFLESGQAKQTRLAGERIAATLASGKNVFVVCAGHIHVLGSAVPREFARLTMYGRPWEWRDAVLQAGDMLIYIGYLDYPRKDVEKALASGANAVTLSASEGVDDDRRVHVRSPWRPWDTCVNIRDYPVRILPSSGVVETVEWHSIIAEAVKASGAK